MFLILEEYDTLQLIYAWSQHFMNSSMAVSIVFHLLMTFHFLLN